VARQVKLLGPNSGRLLPEEAAQILVLQQRHDEPLMLSKRRRDMPVFVQLEDMVYKGPPAFAVKTRFTLSRIPLAVKGVEGDPQAHQAKVVILAVWHLLDAGHPATRAMEPDGCGLFTAQGR
jgi:hypothetical protein